MNGEALNFASPRRRGEQRHKTEKPAMKQFKPETSALVLIDHQVGTLQFIRNISADGAVRNAVILAKAAKAFGMPVVLTSSQEDHIQGPLAPSLQKVLPEAFVNRVKRVGIVNAWADKNFSAAVKATGRKQLIMAGVTTDICLVFPAMSAVQEGFEVQAVMDASGSTYEIQEEMARRRMENAGVVLTTTNTMVAELVQDWASPQGSQLIGLLMSTAPMIQGE